VVSFKSRPLYQGLENGWDPELVSEMWIAKVVAQSLHAIQVRKAELRRPWNEERKRREADWKQED
jgi:hypothetical protein